VLPQALGKKDDVDIGLSAALAARPWTSEPAGNHPRQPTRKFTGVPEHHTDPLGERPPPGSGHSIIVTPRRRTPHAAVIAPLGW
jgi:hypothetical protein